MTDSLANTAIKLATESQFTQIDTQKVAIKKIPVSSQNNELVENLDS